MKPPLKTKFSNDFQTPPEALNPLLPHIKRDWVIWECASGNGNLSSALRGAGFRVVETDIRTGHDFLVDKPMDCNCIITNPPYSIKQEFLERCYLLQKPFALLLPLTTFETKKRQSLFIDNGIEVIFLPKRINFETPDGTGNGSWFATAWFTWGLNIGKELNFWKEE